MGVLFFKAQCIFDVDMHISKELVCNSWHKTKAEVCLNAQLELIS